MWTYSDLVAAAEERSAIAAICERAVRVITTRLEVPSDRFTLGTRLHESDPRERVLLSVTRNLHLFVCERDVVIRVRCTRDDSGARTLSIRGGTNLPPDAPWQTMAIKDFSEGEEQAIVDAAFAEAISVLEARQ